MKKFAFILLLFVLFLSSCSKPDKLLDEFYSQKTEIERHLKDTTLSSEDENAMRASLDVLNEKIENLLPEFYVNILPDPLNLESVPYSSENINNIGEWYYNNIIYPLYCYELDYPSISINKEENFSSQEKFYIISYHLINKYSHILTEKYSHLTVSESSMSELSLELFGEDIDSSSVMQFSSESKRYIIPFPTKEERLLVPVLNSCGVRDVTKIEVVVNYAERSLSKSIYSETFVFERKGDRSFKIYSRVRNNQSFSMVGTDLSNISDEKIFVLDSSVIPSQKISETDLKKKGALLCQYYGSVVDNFRGTICLYDKLSAASLMHMILMLDPDIDKLIEEASESYEYFGFTTEYLEQQADCFFENIDIDFASSNLYHSSLDVYLLKISDISRVSYNKQVLDVVEFDNGYIRLETALFHPDNFIQLVAKEVIIFKPQTDGSFRILSRHYNMHTASSMNSFFADIVPVYPEVYPDTSSSDIIKGTWLYKNYGKMLDFEFISCQNLSSEKLANFAVERLLGSDAFKSIASASDHFAFPRLLIEEQVRLFFGETNFTPEYVSYYDRSNDCFYIDPWSVKQKETSGTVVSTGSSENNNFTVYIENQNNNDRMRPAQYVLTFYELENKSFRFCSAQIFE